EAVHLFEIGDAVQHEVAQTGSSRFPGAGEFRGETRPYGALITYSLNVPGLPLPEEEKERARQEREREKKARPATVTAEGVPVEQGGQPLVEEESAQEEGQPGRQPGGRGGRKGPEAKIEVLDGTGKVIRTLRQPATQGVNRAAWNLRLDPYKQIPRK